LLPLPPLRLQEGPAVSEPRVERLAPVQGYAAGIPWSMHLRAYDAYCKKYRPQQALIEGNCRGGFGDTELDEFIPGWREELSELRQLRARVAAAEAERDKLLGAIKEHHAQNGDDRCWLDDITIYKAAGLPIPPYLACVGDKDAMLENCRRFIKNRCEGGGPWKTYAEMEAENERLRAALATAGGGGGPGEGGER
jgi:hypothetical protein